MLSHIFRMVLFVVVALVVLFGVGLVVEYSKEASPTCFIATGGSIVVLVLAFIGWCVTDRD